MIPIKKCLPKEFLWLLCIIVLTGSCENAPKQLSETEKSRIAGEVTQTANDITSRLSEKGPSAWLDYFDDAPGFFMASDGELAFKDYQSAKAFILNTLVKNISKISLKWSNLNVDPLSADIAIIHANFHEDITNSDGTTSPFDGYFTATANLKNGKWKLLNLHWSIKKSMNLASR